jgi:hypothetical protein
MLGIMLVSSYEVDTHESAGLPPSPKPRPQPPTARSCSNETLSASSAFAATSSHHLNLLHRSAPASQTASTPEIGRAR